MDPEPDGTVEQVGSGGLGSLAQSARLKHLNTARWTLIVIGVLTILVNGVLLTTAREAAMAEIRKQNMVIVNQAEFDHGVNLLRLIIAVPIVLGVIFIGLGLMVKTYPVPITIVALVLYIGATLAFGMLDPPSLAQGLIIKVVIVFGMVKAIQAAFAYEREQAKLLYEAE